MMMNPNLQDKVDSHRYEEMVRYANEQHRAQELTAGNKNSNTSIYKPALASLGKLLSEVGDQLQERYGKQSDGDTVGNYQLETAK